MCMTIYRNTIDSDVSVNKRKRESEKGSGRGGGRRQEQEDEVDQYYRTLVNKHKEMFITPQYRLWARMHVAGIHDSMDDPPDVPAFSSNPPKRQRKNSLTESLTGAAVAFANTLSHNAGDSPLQSGQSSHGVGISPRKAVELRMKNYEQLRYIQQLFDDNILSEEEYKEQKLNILGSLRKL